MAQNFSPGKSDWAHARTSRDSPVIIVDSRCGILLRREQSRSKSSGSTLGIGSNAIVSHYKDCPGLPDSLRADYHARRAQEVFQLLPLHG